MLFGSFGLYRVFENSMHGFSCSIQNISFYSREKEIVFWISQALRSIYIFFLHNMPSVNVSTVTDSWFCDFHQFSKDLLRRSSPCTYISILEMRRYYMKKGLCALGLQKRDLGRPVWLLRWPCYKALPPAPMLTEVYIQIMFDHDLTI